MKSNKHRPILSAAKMYVNDISFEHYKLFLDIRNLKAFIGELSSN